MADWRDVMEYRSTASEAIGAARATAKLHGEGHREAPTIPTAAEVVAAGLIAVCCELRALGTTIDHASTNRLAGLA